MTEAEINAELLAALKVASRLLFLYIPAAEGYGIPGRKGQN